MFSRKCSCVLELSSIPSPIRPDVSEVFDDVIELTTVNEKRDGNFLEYKSPHCNSENHELNISFIERTGSPESSLISSHELKRPMLPGRESESFVTTDTSTEAEEHLVEEYSGGSSSILSNKLPLTLRSGRYSYRYMRNFRVQSPLATQKVCFNDKNHSVVADAINNDIKIISSLLYEGGFKKWSLDGFDLSDMDVTSEIWNRRIAQCRTDIIKEFEKDQTEKIYLVHFRQFLTRHAYLENAQKAMSELEKFDELHSLVNRARNMWMQQLLFNIAKVSKEEFEKFAQKALNFDFIGIDKQSLMNCISLIKRDFNVVDRLNTLPPEDLKNTTFLRLPMDTSIDQSNSEAHEKELENAINKLSFNDACPIEDVLKNKNNGCSSIIYEDKVSKKKKKHRRFIGLLQRMSKLFRKKQ